MVVRLLLARRARQCMAASSSYESVIELILLQWLAMAAISRPCSFVASTPVEEHRPSFETLRHTSIKAVGTVLCDCCLEGRYTRKSAFLSDVSVAVECKNRNGGENFVWQAGSDRKGNFVIDIPSLGTIQKCWVRLLNNPHGFCNSRRASATKGTIGSALLTLQSLDQSNIVYTVGEFSYQPKAPFSCCRKGMIAHGITAYGSLNGKPQRNFPRKLIKNFDAQVQKAFNGAHELLHQSRRRSLLAVNKHASRPTSYHLEPPDPPQPLYPTLKKNTESAPAAYQRVPPNCP